MGLQAYRQNRKDEEGYQGILRVSFSGEVERRSEDPEVRGEHEEDYSEPDETQGGRPHPEGEQSSPGVCEEVVPTRLPPAREIDLQRLGGGVVSQPDGLDHEANQNTNRQDVADDRLKVAPPNAHAVIPL